jgi:hypothetical protein
MQIVWGAPDRAGQHALPVHLHTTKISCCRIPVPERFERQRSCTRVHVLRGGNGCSGRWAMNHGPDVSRRAKNGVQPLTTNLSADSVSEDNGESEDDEGKNESN